MTHQQFDPGTIVYDVHGKWVGIVSLRNTPGETLAVQKGRWFPKDVYLPAVAIARADDEGVHLRLTRSDLQDRKYADGPAEEDAWVHDADDGDASAHQQDATFAPR